MPTPARKAPILPHPRRRWMARAVDAGGEQRGPHRGDTSPQSEGVREQTAPVPGRGLHQGTIGSRRRWRQRSAYPGYGTQDEQNLLLRP